MKEKTLFIDLTHNDLVNYIWSLFDNVVVEFLKENQDIKIEDLLVDKANFSETTRNILMGDLTSVKDKIAFYRFVERVYDAWRNYKRYVIIDSSKTMLISDQNFLEVFDRFNKTLISSYRRICENLTGKQFSVYRELPAGGNAGILLNRLANDIYPALADINVVEKVAFLTPFVSYSANNKRSGIFPITDKNPLLSLEIKDKNDWLCVPILVGHSKVFVYFKKRYTSLALSLSNLFEFDSEYKKGRPDCIILFGSNVEDGIYYDDKEKVIVANLLERDEIDYFGYLKKIILTAHNLKMIKEDKLPIHGAGVSILLKNNERKNVILVGDSGAGKSETLEALRRVALDYIYDIQTIYDDMGTLEIVDGEIYTYGTEIGAFVRTDDLANDYVYKVFDRAIFLNPNEKNARLVLPVSSYQTVINKYKVDFLLYANNYEESAQKIKQFLDSNTALETFKAGRRVALGTTSEKGLVSTYFANPFGPVQEREKTDLLLDKYFDLLFKKQIFVGEIHTGLALENGSEKPLEAALELLEKLKER